MAHPGRGKFRGDCGERRESLGSFPTAAEMPPGNMLKTGEEELIPSESRCGIWDAFIRDFVGCSKSRRRRSKEKTTHAR